MLTVTADPPTLVTRRSRVRVIPEQARVEALCAAKGAVGWNALMAPTLGREGEVLGCDVQGGYLVRFAPLGGGGEEGEKEEEGEGEDGARKGSLFFGGATPRLAVSFHYPPQALQLVSGGEPTVGARVRALTDKAEVQRLAEGHGGWDEGMGKVRREKRGREEEREKARPTIARVTT